MHLMHIESSFPHQINMQQEKPFLFQDTASFIQAQFLSKALPIFNWKLKLKNRKFKSIASNPNQNNHEEILRAINS